MDLSKIINEKKLYLCRWHFQSGFALLLFLWAVNSVWFLKKAFVVPAYNKQKEINVFFFDNVGGVGLLREQQQHKTYNLWIT
ncbi:hypothetical protein HCN44_003756 [Aphidius gifuensis]|uniref:Uncharacterized protein n=1 Tax=Aphidius gifuensis TaxID=684658 RepID=A0A834XKH1_APHGI|nr:hypothetical protein HCN44_003756 [Aphidius gifuensis]